MKRKKRKKKKRKWKRPFAVLLLLPTSTSNRFVQHNEQHRARVRVIRGAKLRRNWVNNMTAVASGRADGSDRQNKVQRGRPARDYGRVGR